MFELLWGPVVAAISVVLDHADAGPIVSTALGGLLHAARIAAFHHVNEVSHRDCSFPSLPPATPFTPYPSPSSALSATQGRADLPLRSMQAAC